MFLQYFDWGGDFASLVDITSEVTPTSSCNTLEFPPPPPTLGEVLKKPSILIGPTQEPMNVLLHNPAMYTRQ